MTMVSARPYGLDHNQFEKSALVGPNVKSYNGDYNRFQPKAAPIKVPDYKLPEGNKWQNTYGKMQTNSHPDFKPIYGPQENKRPQDMMDFYKQKEQQLKENEDKTKVNKERQENKQQTPKKQRQSPREDKISHYESKETPKKVIRTKEEKVANQKKEQPVNDEKVANQKKQQSPKADKAKRQQRQRYEEPERRKPFNKNDIVGPNIQSYNNNFDRKFPLKSNNMTVPNYKPGEGNKWQKMYGKTQSSSHPDFIPIYGPQKIKRGINILDLYKQQKEKKEQPVKEKKVQPKKERNQPDKKHEDTHEPEKSPKKEKNETKKQPKMKDKPEDSPRRAYKDSPKHVESRGQRDSSLSETENKDEKYYGYQERPTRRDNKKEQVTSDLNQSKLKQRDSGITHQKEITPREKKKEENKKEDKVTPRGKKDPFEKWEMEEKEKSKPKENKADPYNYKRDDDIDRGNKRKEETQKTEKRNIVKEADNDKKKNRPLNEQQARRPVHNDREREDDSTLYTSREHARPAKTQNNNTSIVRDGGLPATDKRNKPTAKILPTSRDTKDDRKWLKEGKYTNSREEKSVRARFYEKADMDDILQDKIATQLRQNGIAETKVVPLSAKITQAVRDDVIDVNQNMSPHVTANLTDVINKHLDCILFNKANATDLRDAQKMRDVKHLSNLVLMRMGQVHEEIELCKLSVDDPRNKKGKGHTPRDEPQDRSMIMAIKDGIEQQKTERDIIKDKLMQAENEAHVAEDVVQKRQGELQNLDANNWQLRQDLNDTEQSKQELTSKLREQQKAYDNLDKQHQEARHENMTIKSRLNESDGYNQSLSGELAKLQSENARLKVLTSQKEKEILHLRDPDKDMVHRIRILSDEVTMLRTQSRRLNEEKALLKSRSQKMESSLDESNRQKGKLSMERENLLKENQDLKQRYRKLALANPKERALPEIMTGRNNPSYQSTPRTNSRAPSRSLRNSDN